MQLYIMQPLPQPGNLRFSIYKRLLLKPISHFLVTSHDKTMSLSFLHTFEVGHLKPRDSKILKCHQRKLKMLHICRGSCN